MPKSPRQRPSRYQRLMKKAIQELNVAVAYAEDGAPHSARMCAEEAAKCLEQARLAREWVLARAIKQGLVSKADIPIDLLILTEPRKRGGKRSCHQPSAIRE